MGSRALGALKQRYPLHELTDVEPRVYWRLTDNWLELTLRFIASATYDIVGIPPMVVRQGDGARKG